MRLCLLLFLTNFGTPELHRGVGEAASIDAALHSLSLELLQVFGSTSEIIEVDQTPAAASSPQGWVEFVPPNRNKNKTNTGQSSQSIHRSGAAALKPAHNTAFQRSQPLIPPQPQFDIRTTTAATLAPTKHESTTTKLQTYNLDSLDSLSAPSSKVTDINVLVLTKRKATLRAKTITSTNPENIIKSKKEKVKAFKAISNPTVLLESVRIATETSRVIPISQSPLVHLVTSAPHTESQNTSLPETPLSKPPTPPSTIFKPPSTPSTPSKQTSTPILVNSKPSSSPPQSVQPPEVKGRKPGKPVYFIQQFHNMADTQATSSRPATTSQSPISSTYKQSTIHPQQSTVPTKQSTRLPQTSTAATKQSTRLPKQ